MYRLDDRINDRRAPRSASIALLSTYIPQQCGLATFAGDLARGIRHADPSVRLKVLAIDDDKRTQPYPPDVVRTIRKNWRPSYRELAAWINDSDIDALLVQHEFGIFGGPEGEWLVDLLDHVRRPIVTTLHTVLQDPPLPYLRRMREVVERSTRLVALTPSALDILRERYGVGSDRVEVIPHGVPNRTFISPDKRRRAIDAEGRTVLMTFGLLGPSKGIEDMIEAMATIVKTHPETLYIVVGATHPGVIAHAGESYRLSLVEQVKRLGLENNVRFVDRYMESNELFEWIEGCDIYVTPYPNRDQISSGTVAVAVGLGRAVVATRFRYAEDLLADDRGVLVEPNAPGELAGAVLDLLDNPRRRGELQERAYAFGREMTWESVGARYLELARMLTATENIPGADSDRLSMVVPDLSVRVAAPYVRRSSLR